MELWQGAVVSWGREDGDSCFLMYEIGNKRSAKVNARTSRDLGAWCDWDVGCRGELELGVVLALDCTSHTLASASLIAAAYRGAARLLICRPRHLHLTPQRASPSDSCQDTLLCSFAACFCTSEASPPEHL